jgi:acyl-coenzyme A thioesterase PaaI-like protein
MGSVLLPPFTLTKFGPGDVEMRGQFTRYHVGGNSAVHGGVLPLLFDNLLGTVVKAFGRPISRTAFLHVDYRKVTPIDVPLVVRGRVDRAEGRKLFVSAELTEAEEVLLAEAHGLMVELLPGQP